MNRQEIVMLRPLLELEHWVVEGVNRIDVGKIDDVYFDDDLWTVRYMVARTGDWLGGRSVLISPMAITMADWGNGRLRTNLTRDDIKDAPTAEAAMPVSRRYESTYATYYGYPFYWTGGELWGSAPNPAAIPRGTPGSEPVPIVIAGADASHLRGAKEVRGYHIQASDGEIGHLDDFIVDDETWRVRYLEIDTSNWIGGKEVLVSPDWVTHVDWPTQRIEVDVPRERIKSSPEYDPKQLPRDYEDRLHRHYERPPYWL